MRNIDSTWFETKVKYQKTQADGSMKHVTETYVVDAFTFTEAESVIIDEMSAYTSGELSVEAISKALYSTVFFSDMEEDDKWFKVKVQIIMMDEKTEKEKRTNRYVLVQAKNAARSLRYVVEVMGAGMEDYDIAGVSGTQFMDVFEHHAPGDKKAEEKNDVPEYEQAPAE